MCVCVCICGFNGSDCIGPCRECVGVSELWSVWFLGVRRVQLRSSLSSLASHYINLKL